MKGGMQQKSMTIGSVGTGKDLPGLGFTAPARPTLWILSMGTGIFPAADGPKISLTMNVSTASPRVFCIAELASQGPDASRRVNYAFDAESSV